MHELLEGVGESLLGTHFTCFTSTNVQMLAQNALLARHFTPQCRGALSVCHMYVYARYSLYLLYQYRSANTDTWGASFAQVLNVEEHFLTCTQCTCFTGTKGLALLTTNGLASLQPLDVEEHFLKVARAKGTHFTCFTGTKVQILTQQALLAGSGWQRAS